MKKFKITLLLLTISLFAATTILAQDNSEKELAIEKQLNEIDDIYKLSKTQKVEVKKLAEVFIDEQAKIKMMDVSSYFELKNAYHEASRKFHNEVKEILTFGQKNSDNAMFYFPHVEIQSDKQVCISTSKSRALQVALKNYEHKKMRTTLIAQRKKLDDKISPADQSKIAALRQDLIDAKAALKRFEQDNHYGMISAAGLSPTARKAYGIIADRLHAKQAHLNALGLKYDDDINLLFEEIDSSMARWEEEQKAIEYEYFPQKKEREAKWTKAKKDKVKESDLRVLKLKFLQLDKDSDNTFSNQIEVEESHYGGSSTIYFELRDAGDIQLELVDYFNGKVLQTILSEHYESGFHTLSIDYLDLKAGFYAYVLTMPNGKQMKASFKCFRH